MTSNFVTIFTSRTGWLAIGTGVFTLLSFVYPILPQPWSGLIAAILAVMTYYHIGKSVNGARTAGVRGV